jgi:tetratricopeptide (TPR) repeat protein
MMQESIQGIRKVYLLFFLLAGVGIFLLDCDNCRAETLSQAKAKFYRANTYYSDGEYDKAISEYEKVPVLGFESGNLYYNLGNAYFKKGELGKALLNYEKARRFIPRDNDLKSNYTYARSLIKGSVSEAKKKWWAMAFDKLFSPFTIDGMAILLAMIFTGICLVILATVFIPSIKKYRVSALSILAITFALSSIATFKKISAIGKEAVIIVERTDAKFEPFERATTHFSLYEGTKVRVLSFKDSWCKVERLDKKTGWVKTLDLETF